MTCQPRHRLPAPSPRARNSFTRRTRRIRIAWDTGLGAPSCAFITSRAHSTIGIRQSRTRSRQDENSFCSTTRGLERLLHRDRRTRWHLAARASRGVRPGRFHTSPDRRSWVYASSAGATLRTSSGDSLLPSIFGCVVCIVLLAIAPVGQPALRSANPRCSASITSTGSRDAGWLPHPRRPEESTAMALVRKERVESEPACRDCACS
jgi:hypothetical protein